MSIDLFVVVIRVVFSSSICFFGILMTIKWKLILPFAYEPLNDYCWCDASIF